MSLPLDNAEQIADWNGPVGQRWAVLRQQTSGIVHTFGDAAFDLAAAQPGERVLDIGCGCGDTTLALAQRVGATGRVLGVDVSQPMLDVARAAAVGLPQLSYLQADASAVPLPADNDLLFSRFGVMFFAQPAAALAHLRAALRVGGRCVFVCWRTPRDNPWAMAPLLAARRAAGVTPPKADPFAPGPFAFADDSRLRGLLQQAGFDQVVLQRLDASVTLGATAREAAENAARVGPTSRFVRDQPAAQLPAIVDAIERSLAALAAPDGPVHLAGSTWLVSARNP
jgi:ubiquinone/menaquinone biosynthesis C-methylase UbiE